MPVDPIAGRVLFPGALAQTKGRSMNRLVFPGTPSQNDSLPFEVFWLNLVKSITNQRKIQKIANPILLSQCNKNYNFLQRCIYF
jgi:hypothetical protein